MNEKEKSILVIGVDPSKCNLNMGLLQQRRLADTIDQPTLIHTFNLITEEADLLTLAMLPTEQVTVKQPVINAYKRYKELYLEKDLFMNDCHLAIINEVHKTINNLLIDKAFEGCRTPAPFRNDKGIYRQHKRQRKHK